MLRSPSQGAEEPIVEPATDSSLSAHAEDDALILMLIFSLEKVMHGPQWMKICSQNKVHVAFQASVCMCWHNANLHHNQRMVVHN